MNLFLWLNRLPFQRKLKEGIRSMMLFLQFIAKQSVCNIKPSCVKKRIFNYSDEETSFILEAGHQNRLQKMGGSTPSSVTTMQALTSNNFLALGHIMKNTKTRTQKSFLISPLIIQVDHDWKSIALFMITSTFQKLQPSYGICMTVVWSQFLSVFNPFHLLIQPVLHQLLYQDVMGDKIESLAEIRVDNIHGCPLTYQASFWKVIWTSQTLKLNGGFICPLLLFWHISKALEPPKTQNSKNLLNSNLYLFMLILYPFGLVPILTVSLNSSVLPFHVPIKRNYTYTQPSFCKKEQAQLLPFTFINKLTMLLIILTIVF